MMSLRIIGIQLDRPFEFTFSTRPVTIVIVLDMGQRNMRLGKCPIELDCLQRGLLPFWQRLVWRHRSSRVRRCQKIVSIGQAAVSKREGWILFYRLLKIFERLLHSFLAALVEVKASLKVELISLVAFGVVFGKATLLARAPEFQRVDNRAGHLSLRSSYLGGFS